jgi:hypothetical protein
MGRMNNNEPRTAILVIQGKHRHGGYYVAAVPSSLDAIQVDAAFREAGIEPERMFEIRDWQTVSEGMKVAFVPFLRSS